MGALRNKSWLVTIMCLLAVAAAGCLVKKDSPAPGCVEYWGPAPMGGCFGKTAILDLKVEPQTECLEIAVNNCNGGILEVSNSCAEMLVLHQITVQSGELYVGLDLDRQNGQYVLKRAEGNFSEYVPAEDESVEIRGLLGAQEVKISFVKTRELC
ncbi:MAG: hypothetical protein WCD51_14100 [Anaerolineae bacterium]